MTVVEDVLKIARGDLIGGAKSAAEDAVRYAEKSAEMAEYSQKCLQEVGEIDEALANERDHQERVRF